MFHKKLVSLFILLLGLSILFAGISDLQMISSDYNTLVPISPETETKILIILGAAASISGFSGLLRDKTIEI